MKNQIITHNGIFHADEVLAIALLEVFTSRDNLAVIRTRDLSLVTNESWIIDIGGEFDPQNKKFDHHQGEIEKSSAGLVLDYLVSKKSWTLKAKAKYHISPLMRELVEIVDQHDTGVKNQKDNLFIQIIQGFNDPKDVFGETQNKNFKLAVQFARNIIWASMDNYPLMTIDRIIYGTFIDSPDDFERPYINLYNENLKTIESLKKEKLEVIAKTPIVAEHGVSVMRFQKGDIFIPVSELIGLADIAIQWDNGQQVWSIQTIPLKNGEFETLYKLSPIGDETFFHKGGFIAKSPSGKFKGVKNV